MHSPRSFWWVLPLDLHPHFYPVAFVLLSLTLPRRLPQILFISSWLSWIIESRSNYGLRSIERNVYWATVTLTTVGCVLFLCAVAWPCTHPRALSW